MAKARTYSVVLPDGSHHPPADLVTLASWVIEGRIHPDTLLVPEGLNVTIAASTVPGLAFPADRSQRSQIEPGMSTELRSAWICAALSVFGGFIPCFGRVSGAAALVGIFLSIGVRRRRERGAVPALVVNALGLILTLLWIVASRFTG